MNQNLGPEEAAKLEAIERLVASLREDAGPAQESLGSRAADRVAGIVGSWKFLIGQSFLLLCWVVHNIRLVEADAFDPYPFILLNLCLSFQAAFTAPIILMAQNRSESNDRRHAKKAYRTIAQIKELVKILAQMEGVQTIEQSELSSKAPSSKEDA